MQCDETGKQGLIQMRCTEKVYETWKEESIEEKTSLLEVYTG